MATSIDRNWIAGLSSGLDTHSLIEQMMNVERVPLDRLEQKRNTLTYQKSMLQEINLSLYELQNKSSNMLFSSTFSTKKVNTSDEKIATAKATTAAAVGSYNIRIKQVATNTSVSSAKRLAGVIEQGHNVSSTTSVGGKYTTLDAIGVSPGILDFSINGGSVKSLSLGLTGTSTAAEAVTAINQKIDADSELKGKLTVTFDELNNKLKFNLLDESKSIQIKDGTGSDMIEKMFDPDSEGITINKNTPVKESALADIRSGLNATLGGLEISTGTFNIQRSGGPVEEFDLSSLTSNSTVSDLMDLLNSQIDTKNSLNPTGDPDDRLLEFRFDESTGKILLTNTDTTDTVSFAVSDGTGNLSERLFGDPGPVASTFDEGKVIMDETFATAITSGKFTIDGVTLSVDIQNDTLQNVLSKITSSTGITASYDSENDKIILTRKDGLSNPIGIGAAGDTSNFLSAVGLMAGTQTGSELESAGSVSGVRSSLPLNYAGFAETVSTGQFTINGVKFNIVNPESMSLDTIIDAVNSNTTVGVTAHFDTTSGKLILTSKNTGNMSISLGSSTDTSNFLSVVGLAGATQDVGQNAIFSVDGINGGADMIRQSNEVTDVIEGLTLTLKGVTGTNSETIAVESDTETARTAIDEFLEAYNKAVELIYTRLTEKRDWELDALTDTEISSLSESDLLAYETQYKVGLLSGDSTLTSVRSSMRSILSGMVSGLDETLNSLSSIGISTGEIGSSYQDTQTGLLKIQDEDKLMTALREKPDKVAELFAKDSTSEGSKGLIRRLRDTLNEYTKSDGILTKRVGRSGLTTTNSQMDQHISLINNQISRYEERMEARENALIQQFSNLETALSKYQSQSDAFLQQLSQLTGSSS